MRVPTCGAFNRIDLKRLVKVFTNLPSQSLRHRHVSTMNFTKEDRLDLNALRFALIRMEDTIIYGLIERAQYKHNQVIYTPGHFDFANHFKGSFMGYFLHETECLHAKIRRYTSPDEYPFTKGLPEMVLPYIQYPSSYKPNLKININSKILPLYRDTIVPAICETGDDGNYGSSAMLDTENLQALSKRIHYGKFVAEAKFSNPQTHDKYVELIKKQDSDGLMELLTNREVEERLLNRVRRKVIAYGQDVTDTMYNMEHLKLKPDIVVDLYEKWIIPLTKEVEVDYLLRRLDCDSTPENLHIGEIFDPTTI
eukprot:comp21354_c0_seq1/m.29317 comp21354_c0_seq1/g.29317  ORF comp21354_c0_seq1/g.29317 comp21354_c0_seq1/m.29317 type:complete len:310 (-) comp21354_c0_seq1:37-966(-)